MHIFKSRVFRALEENNSRAGYDIYDSETNTIVIRDKNNLTIYEKYAILITHTANVTFNSFAAEVVVHANFLDPKLPIIYDRAIRADMGISEEKESGISDSLYYDLNSPYVQYQIRYHGEY